MRHKRRIISVRLTSFMGVLCGLVLVGMSLPPKSTAQRSRESRIQKWEYCAILHAYTKWPQESKEKYVATATICYFRNSGCRKEEVIFELTYSDFLKEEGTANQGESYNRTYGAPARATESALSKAITKLGDNGWEMVGENRIDFSSGVDVNTKAIYFKRRRSQ